MIEWLHGHRMAFLLAMKKLRATPMSHLLMAGVIGASLSLPAGFYLLVENLKGAAGGIAAEPQLTLFLAQKTSAETIRELEARLRANPAIGDLRFVPRDAAWKELQEKNGLGEAARGIEKNPLPDVFIVHAGNTDPAAIEALQQELAQWPEVEHAQLDSAWVKRLHTLLQLGNKGVAVLAGLLGFALVAIIGNTIRLQILTQREEIEVSTLIGATDRFIRRPFLYTGTLHGLSGGIMAWLIVYAALYAFNVSVEELALQYSTDFHLEPLELNASLVLVGCSAALGWLGSYLEVSRHLSATHTP